MHWLIVDIPNGEKIKDGIEKMKFAPSKIEKINRHFCFKKKFTEIFFLGSPPENSGKHRYIFLLFGHKSRVGGKKTSKITARKSFEIEKFSSENGLGDPILVNFYYTKN